VIRWLQLVTDDIMVCTSNIDPVPEMVRFFHGEGVERYDLWLFSSVDQGDEAFVPIPAVS